MSEFRALAAPDPALQAPTRALPRAALAGKGGRVGVGAEAAQPLAIYIHWPFCRSKCPYCDFNSHVREGIDSARWTRALIADLDQQAALAPDPIVGSIFFG